MSSRIHLSVPDFGDIEKGNVLAALNDNAIVDGKFLSLFESALMDQIGAKNLTLTHSGTSALHLALILADIQPRDVVLCSSFTFVASANPIKYVNAEPVFIDSEKETWGMDPVLLEEAILDLYGKGIKPKALIFVHVYGMPGKILEVKEICKKHDIFLIEDAAEALGSTLNGQSLGTFGDIGVLSFNGNKIISSAGGGALISDDKRLVDRARYLASQARDPQQFYEHSEVGYNYRISNICAALGYGQMQRLDSRVSRRREIHDYYCKSLSIKGLSFLTEESNSFTNRWLSTILIDKDEFGKSADHVRLLLEENNIESRLLWKPMHTQPLFLGEKRYLNGTSESLFEMGLCLPSSSGIREKDLNRVIRCVRA